MKNQIVKKGLRFVLLGCVGIAVVGTFVFLWKKAQPVKTTYQIVQPSTGDIATKTVATGNVEPRHEVEIKPQISGIIAELKKEAGDMVQNGEIIAVIKVIPEMVQLNSSESRVNVAEISLRQVEELFYRDKALFEQGVISREEYEKSEADYLKAKEEKATAQSELEIVRDGISRNSDVASTTQIRSTISGMILDIPVKVGNSVIQSNNFNDGTTIATVADMNDMIFKGNVDETEIGRIHTDMPINLTIGAMESRSFPANLEYVSPKGVEKNGAGAFQFCNIFCSRRCNTGHSLKNIQRKSFTVKQGPVSGLDFQNPVSFLYLVSVMDKFFPAEVIFEPFVNLPYYFQPGNHSVCLCRHHGGSFGFDRDYGVRAYVAGFYIFFNSEVDKGLDQTFLVHCLYSFTGDTLIS